MPTALIERWRRANRPELEASKPRPHDCLRFSSVFHDGVTSRFQTPPDRSRCSHQQASRARAADSPPHRSVLMWRLLSGWNVLLEGAACAPIRHDVRRASSNASSQNVHWRQVFLLFRVCHINVEVTADNLPSMAIINKDDTTLLEEVLFLESAKEWTLKEIRLKVVHICYMCSDVPCWRSH